MHPTLIALGPWEPLHLPAVFAFFLAVVGLWTYLERRGSDGGWSLTRGLVLEVLIQAAIPTALTYLLVNRIGPVQVRSYGVMMLAAFVAATAWMYHDRDRYGFGGSQVLQLALLGFAGGIVGGRLGYVALSWGEYAGRVEGVFDLWRGGMSWHGGLAGGLLVLGVCAPLMGARFTRVLDLAAPGIALGYALARIGCFLNGCCRGSACTLPWAVTFPPTPETTALPVPVHPTQLYAALLSVGFTLPLLLWLTPWLRKPFDRFLGFLVLSSMARYVVEIFRRGASGEVWAPWPIFTAAQAASLAIIIIAGAVIVIREWPLWRRKTAERAGAEESA